MPPSLRRRTRQTLALRSGAWRKPQARGDGDLRANGLHAAGTGEKLRRSRATSSSGYLSGSLPLTPRESTGLRSQQLVDPGGDAPA